MNDFKFPLILMLGVALSLPTGSAQADELHDEIVADYPYLRALYEHFHEHPELSLKETKTAARLADEWRQIGYTVTENVGGTGVVAVLKNGAGPTLLLRADMDGLPLEEQTGLPYASRDRGVDRRNLESFVMHACAHDSHMAALVGTARQLHSRQDQWSGTLVLVGQPAEELGLGSLAMLEDGLFDRFPTPDYNLSFHTFSQIPTGTIGYVSGYAMANVDTVDITVRGIGGHGSAPHNTRDPVVLAAQIVVALQTLVSRETDPLESGVVTVGAIHGGTKHNIISDSVHLQLTVRSYTDAVREQLLSGIERIAHGQAASSGLAEDLWPIVEVEDPYTPATYNDPALVTRSVKVMRDRFGSDAIQEKAPIMGGEDFARYSRTAHDIPSFMFWVGGTSPATFAEYAKKGQTPPPNHSPLFAPDPEPTLIMATEALTGVSLDLLAPLGTQPTP